MRTIHKFPLAPVGATEIRVPAGSKLLSIQAQDDKPVVWFEVDPARAPTVEVVLVARLTGGGVPDGEHQTYSYIATVQLYDDDFVVHYYRKD